LGTELGTFPKKTVSEKSPLNSSIKVIEQFSAILHYLGEIIKKKEGGPVTIVL
jgi:hypothetical protein